MKQTPYLDRIYVVLDGEIKRHIKTLGVTLGVAGESNPVSCESTQENRIIGRGNTGTKALRQSTCISENKWD